MSISRRRLLKAAAASATAAVLTGLYTWRVEPHWLQLVERDLPLANLPADLDGRTLALLTDLHVGRRVDDDYIIRTFQRVASARPAFVAVVGDLVSAQSIELDQLRGVLEYLPRGSLGTFVALGNHDYGPGWGKLEIAAQVEALVTAAGGTVLRNRSTVTSGLQVAGHDDLWAKRCEPRSVIAALEPGVATVTLCHNPDAADLDGWQAYQGWILAGHTHGGQCKPPFLPPPILPVANKRYTSGEFALSGNRRLYISRGVGHLQRVRFNVRPEVTLFRLVGA